ncbi:hypothetical protein PG999_010833 [Apiospora kogelbergensis]|uniref:Uncharacterized protein n=1 Tax=Apiospora kogelbergensis TaxID=1337665 RepID=A0AAW0QMF1_9PEZI
MAHIPIYDEWGPEIRPIKIDHAAEKVAYDIWGLSINDHHYDRNVTTYLPRIALTSTGRVAKKQPKKPQKQSWTYWKAQCIFRGLSPKGSIAQLQERLGGHETAPMSEEFRAIDEQAKKKYEAKRDRAEQAAQDLEQKWASEMNDQQKASTDLRRYLVETFGSGGPKPEAVVIQGDISSGQCWALGVQGAARNLRLAARIVERRNKQLGGVHPALQSTEEWWESRDPQQEQRMEQEKIKAARKQQRLERDLNECEDWDVTGTYQISCPEIEENWGHRDFAGEGLTLKVYRKRTPKGIQMYAKFDFIVATGVFRFERHKRDTRIIPPKQDENRRKRKASDESGSENDEDEVSEVETDYVDIWDESHRTPTPEAFCFGSIRQPSAECRTWNYRWRGEDTGTGEIHLGSEEDLYHIKWYGPRVEKLKGTFGASFLGDSCTITGVKIGVGADLEDMIISNEWANRNERAHARASIW